MTQRRIYQNEFPYFITTNIRERFWFFDNKEYTLLFYKIVIKACKKKDFILYAFGILADHVHLLVKKRDIAGRDTRAVNSLLNTTRIPACFALRSKAGRSAPALKGKDGCALEKARCVEDRVEHTLEKVRCESREEYGFSSGTQCGPSLISQRGLSHISQRGLSHIPQRGLSSPRGYTISDLMQSIKGNFSRQIHIGELWQSRYNFRIIGNKRRLYNTVQYIKYNYQKHGLPENYSRYPYLYLNYKLVHDLFF
ncbi:MAG: hypothetical protein ABIH38_00145 [Patescibacteria group bacterium]